MYPSVKFGHIERAVNYFLRDASEEDKALAKRCLEMVKFGMANTIVTFQDKYWEYGGDQPVEFKGLTIGGFESAFFADLVAAFILENSEDLFHDSAYNGIYRDDGINVIVGSKSTNEICDWLDSFQARVNELLGSDHLQFTCEVWNPDAPPDEKPRNNDVTIHRGNSFPYLLDMEFYWRQEELKFRVHLKPNQLLKYLNVGSTHTKPFFKAIPASVIRCLTTLTSLTQENEDMPINLITSTINCHPSRDFGRTNR